jgi:hypothetical protein
VRPALRSPASCFQSPAPQFRVPPVASGVTADNQRCTWLPGSCRSRGAPDLLNSCSLRPGNCGRSRARYATWSRRITTETPAEWTPGGIRAQARTDHMAQAAAARPAPRQVLPPYFSLPLVIPRPEATGAQEFKQIRKTGAGSATAVIGSTRGQETRPDGRRVVRPGMSHLLVRADAGLHLDIDCAQRSGPIVPTVLTRCAATRRLARLALQFSSSQLPSSPFPCSPAPLFPRAPAPSSPAPQFPVPQFPVPIGSPLPSRPPLSCVKVPAGRADKNRQPGLTEIVTWPKIGRWDEAGSVPHKSRK